MARFPLVVSCVLFGLPALAQDPPRLGIGVRKASEAMRLAHGLDPQLPALEIMEVVPGTVAAERGLRAGDLVLAMEGTPYDDQARFCEQVAASAPGRLVRLLISRRAVLCRTDPEGRKRLGTRSEDPEPFGQWEHQAGGNVARIGALVADVLSPGAARDAGLLAGDLIVQLAQSEIRHRADLLAAIAQLADGEQSSIRFERAMRLPVTAAGRAALAVPAYMTHALLGLIAGPLDLARDDLGKRLALARALRVDGVLDDSPAAAAGLRLFDWLVAIDGDDAPLASPTDLLQRIQQLPANRAFPIVVYRAVKAPAGRTGAERAAALGLRADWNATEARLEIGPVARGSVAESLGLRQGTAVVLLQGQRVNSPEDWPEYLEHVPEGAWLWFGLRLELARLPVHLDARPAVDLTVGAAELAAGETLTANYTCRNLPAGETTLALQVEKDGVPVAAPIRSRTVLPRDEASRSFSLPIPLAATPGTYALCVTLGEGARAVTGRSHFAVRESR